MEKRSAVSAWMLSQCSNYPESYLPVNITSANLASDKLLIPNRKWSSADSALLLLGRKKFDFFLLTPLSYLLSVKSPLLSSSLFLTNSKINWWPTSLSTLKLHLIIKKKCVQSTRLCLTLFAFLINKGYVLTVLSLVLIEIIGSKDWTISRGSLRKRGKFFRKFKLISRKLSGVN